MSRLRGALLWTWFGIAVLFLFTPIVTAVVYSFNVGVGGKQTSAFTGWTTAWYAAAAADQSLGSAVRTSLVTALGAAVLAVVIGSALGYALVRHPSRRVRRLLGALTVVLLIVPETVIGVSLLVFYTQLKVPLSLLTLIAGHTPITISVVAFLVRARLLTLDPHLEEAAADLGANRWKRIAYVLVPQMLPSLGAAALLAYTFSFDDVVVSNFLSTATISTLPVYLYGTLQYGASPAVYAAAVVLFAATVLALAVAAVLLRGVLRRHPRVREGLA